MLHGNITTGTRVIKPTLVGTSDKLRPVPVSGQNVIISDIPEYTGEYDVVPDTEAPQVLDTKNKRLTDYVVVEKIPTFETANDAGGDTFYIGKEVDAWQLIK